MSFPAISMAPDRASGFGVKALVVEDDKLVSATIAVRLKRRGIEPIQFDSIEKAREFLSRNRVAFAILDLGLPDGDGRELLDDIRRSTINYDIPIIVVTGSKDEWLPQEMLGRARAMFLSQKPIDWRCLDFVIDGTVASSLKDP